MLHSKRKTTDRSTSAKKIANLKKEEVSRNRSPLQERTNRDSNMQQLKPIHLRTEDILRVREYKMGQERAKQIDKELEENMDYSTFKRSSTSEWLQSLNCRESLHQLRVEEQKTRLMEHLNPDVKNNKKELLRLYPAGPIQSTNTNSSPAKTTQRFSKSTQRKTERANKTPVRNTKSPMRNRAPELPSPQAPADKFQTQQDVGKLS